MDKKAKLLFITPIHNWSSLTEFEGLARGFLKLGYQDLQMFWLNKSFDILAPAFKISMHNTDYILDENYPYHLASDFIFGNILTMCLRNNYDYVIVGHGGQFQYDILDKLRELRDKHNLIKTRFGVVLYDDPYEIDVTEKYGQHFDFVCTNESNCVETHKLHNQKVMYLQTACDYEDIVKNCVLDEKLFTHIVSVGSGFPERIALFNKLLPFIKQHNLNIKFYGRGWQPLSPEYHPHINQTGLCPQRVTYNLLHNSSCTINLFRIPEVSSLGNTNQRQIQANSPSPRCFQALAANTILISDDSHKDISELTPKDKVYLFNRDSYERFELKLNSAMQSQDWNIRGRKNRSYEVLDAKGTYLNRAEELISQLNTWYE